VWRIGVAVGLFRKEAQSNRRGNTAAFREVDTKCVAEWLSEMRKLVSENLAKPGENELRDDHLTVTCMSPDGHPLITSPISTNKTNSSKFKRSTVDQKKVWTSEQIEIVRSEANCVVAKIGRTRCRQDRDLLCKVCYLVYVSREFPEHWLHNAVEGVIRRCDGFPDKPFAYFQYLLYRERNEHKPRVLRELVRLVVPKELLQPRTLQPSENLSKRLCVTEEL